MTEEEFDALRPSAFAIAYRMLGSVSEAEDVVQEGFLRLHRARAGGERIESPRAYLSTVVSRLSLDLLRSARVRRETYVGEWLPEPLVTSADDDPARKAEIADSLSLAFLVLLESLSPEQRAAFLLREVFDEPYGRIAEIVGTSEQNARELLPLLARGLEPGAALLDVAAGPRGELAGVLLARADDLRDPVVGLVEHLAQQERGALLGRQALEQDEEGERQRVGHLGLAGGIVVGARHERLRQPLADVGLAPDPRRAEVVEREPRDHRRQVGARRLDPLAALARPVQAQEPLLHHVLRLAHAAEHPVGDGERRRAELVELLLGHRSAESLREALPPARIARLPAELALGLRVRGAPHLGHHDRRRLAGRQPAEPARDTPRRLGIQRARQHRQPLPHGRGLVVDDVVDARPAALDRGDGRRRGVLDVDVATRRRRRRRRSGTGACGSAPPSRASGARLIAVPGP